MEVRIHNSSVFRWDREIKASGKNDFFLLRQTTTWVIKNHFVGVNRGGCLSVDTKVKKFLILNSFMLWKFFRFLQINQGFEMNKVDGED